ncbi:hypothetical protein [Ruegeria lacuscaerulensis]|uniref:hypothetical protein n=1 Tax=Ruegeria lacuscaerulensis TaxID=55218 RepID=UPI00147DA5BF|nr:hypothetical protein [Ruegeria lacuscaerulensis]
MIHTILSRYIGFAAVGCGLIALVIYVLMISVTLAHIEAVSGQVPFDMRPLGYNPKDAATLLEALGAEGREYYLSYQLSLDTFYPAMLALTLITTFSWFGRRMPDSKLVRSGIILSVGCALFDYFENTGIATMIWSWPEVSSALVYAASTATIVKSALTTSAVLLSLLTGFLWARLPKEDLCPKTDNGDFVRTADAH